MNFEITGDNLQMVTLNLNPDESIYADAGAMVNMSGNMEMESHITGGVLKGLKRMATGESFFMTEFTPREGRGFASFAGRIPGKIFPVYLQEEDTFIAQKEAFLCAEKSVDLDIAFQKKIASGVFGGEGFVLQRLEGNGYAFLHCCGDIIERYLQPGEVVKVDTGLVVGFDEQIDYDIALTGGVGTVLFGGEGLFLTTLTGPGKVILQSMNLGRLAASLVPYLPKPTQTKSA